MFKSRLYLFIFLPERVETANTVTDQMITDNEWEMIEKHLNNGAPDATPTQVLVFYV